MVNNVSFNGGYNLNQHSRDIENVTKYALGTSIVTPEEGPLTGMGLMLGIGGAIEGVKGGKWLWNNRTDIRGGWTKGMDAYKADLATKKAMFSGGGYKNLGTYKTVWNNYSAKTIQNAIPTGEKFTKLSPEIQALYNKAKNAAELAKQNPTHARRLINIANSKFAKAEAAASEAALKTPATSFFGKIGKGIGKYTGISKLNNSIKGFATKSPAMAKALKFGKGNGWFAAITGAIALFTEVIPTFSQLGAGKGLKQLGKSTAKTAASVGGWAGGMAIGAAIGSIIPGAGTVIGGAIGALCGLVGGCLGSWAATKATEKIVGKNELDIAKEEQAKQMSEEAAQNPQATQELLAAAQQRLEAEGTESEDAKIAFGSMQNLARLNQTQAPTQMYNQQAQNQYAQANTSFEGSTTTNPFAASSNAYDALNKKDFMNEDFMAMSAGLA